MSLDERIDMLNRLSMVQPIIRMNSEKFNIFISSPRNYSMVLLVIDLAPSIACASCMSAYDELLQLAISFRSSPVFKNQLFFGIIHPDEAAIKQLDFEIDPNAPLFLHISRHDDLHTLDSIDIEKVGFHSDMIAQWIEHQTNIEMPFKSNYQKGIVLIVSILLSALLSYSCVNGNFYDFCTERYRRLHLYRRLHD